MMRILTTAIVLLAASTSSIGCDGSSRSTPTSTGIERLLPKISTWRGTLTLDDASPRDTCLAAAIAALEPPVELESSGHLNFAPSGQMSLEIYLDYDLDGPPDAILPTDVGFPVPPLVGESSGVHVLLIAVPGESVWFHSAPEGCATTWMRESASFDGIFSDDLVRLSGQLTQRFRAPIDGAEMVLNYRLEAHRLL